MKSKTLRSNLCCRSAMTDISFTVHRIWLILVGILVITAFTAAGALAGSEIPFQKKGHQGMQQTASGLKKDLLPLDAVQPARIETFTFGLG